MQVSKNVNIFLIIYDLIRYYYEFIQIQISIDCFS